ncbi:unnamed protein product [Polarella glacialis]|uniref:Uncharacterized protein n=1 Tax=Polarella glacialis TaxID=89957 RepID=A0A813EGX4_POLGL|nr:unnamed protein product [Polarella glacialis]
MSPEGLLRAKGSSLISVGRQAAPTRRFLLLLLLLMLVRLKSIRSSGLIAQDAVAIIATFLHDLHKCSRQCTGRAVCFRRRHCRVVTGSRRAQLRLGGLHN